MISYPWTRDGKVLRFHSLPFPSNHSHSHSHETSLAIPIPTESHGTHGTHVNSCIMHTSTVGFYRSVYDFMFFSWIILVRTKISVYNIHEKSCVDCCTATDITFHAFLSIIYLNIIYISVAGLWMHSQKILPPILHRFQVMADYWSNVR